MHIEGKVTKVKAETGIRYVTTNLGSQGMLTTSHHKLKRGTEGLYSHRASKGNVSPLTH